MAKVKPLEDRLLVKRLSSETKTSGGIILPDSAQEKSQKAEVLAVGPGRLLDSGERAPLDVKVGDVVVLGKYGGTEIKVDGEDYVILNESDVLAVVK